MPASASWWSSCRRIRPGRCTSVMAGRRRWATPSRRCSIRRVTRSRASSTTTTPASRSTISPFPCRRARGNSQGEDVAFPEDGYHGEYIRELAQRYLAEVGRDPSHVSDLDAIRRFAVAQLRQEQDQDLRALGVTFDNYYLESSLYTEGRVDATVARLAASGKTYESEGALWLKTTDYGDDKDRVMRKSDGSYTYFVPDVAYHVTKWERGFVRVINIQGGDHHSTVTRVRAGPAGAGPGHSARLPRVRAAQDGDRDARRRGSEAIQARGHVRVGPRPDRRGRARRRALLPGVAQGRHRIRVRHRPGPHAVRRKSRLLPAVRACADMLGVAAGGPDARGGRRRRSPVPTCRRWPAPTRKRCCAGSPTSPANWRSRRAMRLRTR